jgi:membrane protease YdiL (CAAX protease family)
MLIGAIAASDLLANAVTSGGAQIPVKLALAAGFIAWARHSVGLSWFDLGLDRARLHRGLRFGAGAALVVATAIATFVAIPGTSAILESSAVASATPTERVLTPLLLIPVGTVLFEEVIFRGVLLGVLLRVSRPRAAVLTTSVVFGLWHILPAVHSANGAPLAHVVGAVVGTVVVTTIGGLAFGWLRVRSGSLAAPTIAHIATNSFAYVGALLLLH